MSLTGPTGPQLRDAGIFEVSRASANWLGRAMMIIEALPSGWEGIAEEWRMVIRLKVGEPHHHCAWGALTMNAVRHGLVVDTGRSISMQDPRSHSRRSPVWRRVRYIEEGEKKMDVTPTTKKTTIDERVDQYVRIRDKIRDLEKAHDEAIKPYKDALEGLNNLLLQHLQTLGVESARTSSGTVYVSTKTSATVADPKAFWDHVMETGRHELVDKRANKTAVTDYVTETGNAPPGVNYSVAQGVGVRRS